MPAVAAVVLIAGSASAQDMTSADVTRLQQSADQIGSDLAKLRPTDRTAARAMQNELTDLEEEVTYLKVKLRKERVVSRSDYMDVRDRLEDLRSRVNGGDSNSGRYGSGTRSSDPAVESSQIERRHRSAWNHSIRHRDRRSAGDGAQLRHQSS